MEMRFLGKTGVRVSSLVMGTMSFGGDADEATSAALFAAARDAGINTFDCADVYNGGRAETLLGRFAKAERDDLVLTSKAYFPTRGAPNARGASRFHLVRAVEASLRRLDTDRIDVFFLHRYDDETDLEETLRGLELLVQQGKILYPAVSNFAAWQTSRALGLQRALGFAPMVATQPMYNLVKRQAEVEILPMAQAEGIAVLPYSPLGGGLLTGKYAAGGEVRGRIADNAMYATRYGGDGPATTAARFAAHAVELGVDPVTLAVAWVRSHPGVTAPLVGARSVEQLAPALAAGALTLDAAARAAISALSPTPPPATDRNEEATAHNYGAR
ncbi:MAG: oxidoreductase, Aldo/keto reductase family [Pseudomonadota bacterium]|jgi:aryl-alcohol dehydrogenase-like predicted oxidoreductase